MTPKKTPAEAMRRKGRRPERNLRPQRILIVCEGKQTEPNYINGIIDEIYHNLSVTRDETFEVIGTGLNTLGLLRHAEELCTLNRCYRKVFLVFDKDEFPSGHFNDAIYLTQKHDEPPFVAIWSNPCFELWLLLHFQYLKSALPWTDYPNKLKTYIDYKKNLPDIYDLVKAKTDTALSHAEGLYAFHDSIGNTSPSKRDPATKVDVLVRFLRTYQPSLPDVR